MLRTDAKKLETRDFISVGIFSLIYAVVAFVIGGVAQMTPVTFPFMPMIVALFTGTVFMLYVAKIPKKGALSILGVIAAILLFVTGMFWMMSVFFLVFGVIADFICASADFRSFKKNLLAYCVMALAPMGAYIPMVVMPAQFDAFMKNGISFDCAKNGMTAIVGPSGSGKSTIARLIASFWEAESGGVRIGGVDVRNIPLPQIMELVSYVSQDNFLFHLSIRENIRIGKPEATDAEIEAAAKKASCHDFIAALPEGYDTLAGDAGSHLSGGERQRIAIARAILKNSPIVVLDEATAFTDPENEAVIQASIAGLVAGKTLIVIAHRLSTITKADKILVVDKGNVAAEGTHEELLETSNLYKELWKAHMQGKDTAEEVV